MAVDGIVIAASPEDVFAVLADPERYEEWVVGTTGTEQVDPAWPEEGAVLRYEVGVGPLSLTDVTEVQLSDPPRRLVLRARVRPLGEFSIDLRLEPVEGGTRVVLTEEPVEGLVETAHTRVTDAVLSKRNERALERLRRLVEEGGRP